MLIQSLSVLGVVIAGFMVGEQVDIRPGTVAILGAAVLLLITGYGLGPKAQAQKVHEALSEVEWSALLFFCGLFIVVASMEVGLGGNGTLVGAAANVRVAGLSERDGHPISFLKFLKIGTPLMLLSIVISNVYLYVRHFM